jgi:hypothetical protein
MLHTLEPQSPSDSMEVITVDPNQFEWEAL